MSNEVLDVECFASIIVCGEKKGGRAFEHDIVGFANESLCIFL